MSSGAAGDDVMGCPKRQYPEPDPFEAPPLPVERPRHLHYYPNARRKLRFDGSSQRRPIRLCPPRSLRLLRLADGKLHMFLAMDRVSNYVEFHDRTKMLNGSAFLHSVMESISLPDPHGPHR